MKTSLPCLLACLVLTACVSSRKPEPTVVQNDQHQSPTAVVEQPAIQPTNPPIEKAAVQEPPVVVAENPPVANVSIPVEAFATEKKPDPVVVASKPEPPKKAFMLTVVGQNDRPVAPGQKDVLVALYKAEASKKMLLPESYVALWGSGDAKNMVTAVRVYADGKLVRTYKGEFRGPYGEKGEQADLILEGEDIELDPGKAVSITIRCDVSDGFKGWLRAKLSLMYQPYDPDSLYLNFGGRLVLK